MNEQNQMKPNSTGWRKLLAKRWLFPVMYVAVAGIMLTLMWVYQNDMIDSGQQQAAVVSEKTDRQQTTMDNLRGTL